MFKAQAVGNPNLTARSVIHRSLQRQRKSVIIHSQLFFLFMGLSSAIPIAFGLLVDRAIGTGDAYSFMLGLLGLSLCYAVMIWSRYTYIRAEATSSEQEAHLLRCEMVALSLDPKGKLDGVKTGELTSIAISDISQAAQCIVQGLTFAIALLNLLLQFGIVLVVDVRIGIACLVALSTFVIVWRVILPKYVDQSRENQRALAYTASLATDLIAGVRTLRGIGANDVAAKRYSISSKQTLLTSSQLAQTESLLQSLARLLEGIFVATVLGLAGWMVTQQTLTIGELIIVVVTTAKIATLIQLLNYDTSMLTFCWASTERIASVLGLASNVQTCPSGSIAIEHTASASPVSFEKVSFRSLVGLTFQVREGELLGVTSFDPIDSDTLLTLLAGNGYKGQYEGEIRLHGMSVHDVNPDDRRRMILVEQRDIALFEGTLRENLLVGNKSLSDEQLISALDAAAALDVVHSHPVGLDQPVTDRGLTFSGGQRQRIGLARALLANLPILVLPDPTTAIDPITEELAAEGLVKFRHSEAKRLSTVLITSSPALLSKVDRILLLNQGRVVDEGTHSELLTRNSQYQKTVVR